MVNKVSSGNQSLTTICDLGSNVTMLTHRIAKQLGLKGKEVNLAVTKVGNIAKEFESKEYIVPLTDEESEMWEVIAWGNEVTS